MSALSVCAFQHLPRQARLGLNTLSTSWTPQNRAPVAASQILSVSSPLPLGWQAPSGEEEREVTFLECPLRVRVSSSAKEGAARSDSTTQFPVVFLAGGPLLSAVGRRWRRRRDTIKAHRRQRPPQRCLPQLERPSRRSQPRSSQGSHSLLARWGYGGAAAHRSPMTLRLQPAAV